MLVALPVPKLKALHGINTIGVSRRVRGENQWRQAEMTSRERDKTKWHFLSNIWVFKVCLQV